MTCGDDHGGDRRRLSLRRGAHRALAEPLVTVVCQCTHCQRTSGSPYSVMLALPKGSLEFSGDSPDTYGDKGTSGMTMLPAVRHVRLATRH